jgi:hypothetical protein
MKRKQNIEDVFHSVVPVGTAGEWSVGYSGHTDNSAFFAYTDFEVTAIRKILDHTVPVTGAAIMNDVYVDYSYVTGGGATVSGTTSIYTM